MGVLAPRLRTLDGPLVPPSTQAEIFWLTCLQSHLQTPPPTPLKSDPKFRNPWTTFRNTPLSAQKLPSAGGRGSPRICFEVGILLFLLVRSPCKISEPYDNFWIYPPCPPKYVIMWGGRGVPDFCFVLLVRSPCKISEPWDNFGKYPHVPPNMS